jgi:Zn finger protein HypA/HybF involved in hydrogenase expression
MIDIEKDEVECLKCEYVWTEIEFLSLCPKCGNDDVQQTIYLTKEEV